MGLVMSMSFAGSFIVMAYILSKSFLKNVFTSKFRSRVLIMALFFYLVPFQTGKSFFASILNLFWVSQQENKIIDMSRNVIQLTSTGQFYFPTFPIKIIFLFLWGIIAGVIICWGFIIYFKQRKHILRASENILDDDLLCSVETIKKRMGIKRKIVYRTSYNIEEPLTLGIFRPIVVLPNQQYNKEESNFIYEHELLHIKNCDTLFKILGLFVIALNWYNPLAYFLFLELNIVNENVCDETIVLSMGKEQKICYANLILEMVTQKESVSPIFVASFSNNKKKVEERILLMMNVKKQKRSLKVIAGCLLVLLGITSSLTVFAYEKPIILTVKNVDEMSKNNIKEKMDAVFVADDVTGTEMENCDSAIYPFAAVNKTKLLAEKYFQDEMGNVYEVDNQNIQRGCAHTYVNGTYNEHIKSGKSCSIYIYSAQRCSKCGYTIHGNLDNRVDYAKCTH